MGKLIDWLNPHRCKPEPYAVEGADHIGDDVWLRCSKCGRQTVNHVEVAGRITPKAQSVLDKEWRAGRTEILKDPSDAR